MPYIVIENTPGYMPDDDDPATFDDYADAVAYMRERVADYVDTIAEGDAEVEEWASPDNLSACVVYRRDTVAPDLGRYFGVERDDA